MEKNLFNRLKASMAQMEEIDRGLRQPSRGFHVDAAAANTIHDQRCIAERPDPNRALLLEK